MLLKPELLQFSCIEHFSCIECIHISPALSCQAAAVLLLYCGVSHVCFHNEFCGHARRGCGYSQAFTVQAALSMH